MPPLRVPERRGTRTLRARARPAQSRRGGAHTPAQTDHPVPVLCKTHDFPALRPRSRTATPTEVTEISSVSHNSAHACSLIFESSTNGHAKSMHTLRKNPPLTARQGHFYPKIRRQLIAKPALIAPAAKPHLARTPILPSDTFQRPESFPLAAKRAWSPV